MSKLSEAIEAGRADGREVTLFVEELLTSLEARIEALEAPVNAQTQAPTTATKKASAADLPPVPTV